MTFRIATAADRHPAGEDERNVATPVRAIEHAAHDGADSCAFRKTYPGPWRMRRATIRSRRSPKRRRPIACTAVVGTSSRSIARLRPRTTHRDGVSGRPRAGALSAHDSERPWIYTGGSTWIQYVAGNEFPVFDTAHGKVGLAMCSEVYMPEVTRSLALRGAELIFMPAGVDKRRLWATWRTLIWARHRESGGSGDHAEFV